MASTEAHGLDWIDPFCPLLSDRIGVMPGDPPKPVDPAAVRTARALAHFPGGDSVAAPVTIDGSPAALDEALTTVAGMMSTWRQPLFGGLGTDVAGARALTRLALRCGAILDHAHGDAMTQSLRAVQDRGGFTCTLAEVRNRADLIVCVGMNPASVAPDFFRRCGVGETIPEAPTRREVIFLQFEGAGGADGTSGGNVDAGPLQAGVAPDVSGVHVETLASSGDAHVVLAELNAACSRRKLPRASDGWPALQALGERLLAARYAVLVHALPSVLPGGHAALLVEALARIVKTLNRSTRAAAFPLSSADGSATVGQTATWLTGLPLRTALHEDGFDHDPHRFGTRRLLRDGAVDGLLWVSSFSPELIPPMPAAPPPPPPLVVLGHPVMAAAFSRNGSAGHAARVFIAVSTPGVNAPGHLFRSDGGIVLALKPFATSPLPSVADIARRLLGLMEKSA